MKQARLVALAVGVGVVGLLIYGNLALIGASWAARVVTDTKAPAGVEGVRHLVEVDRQVWRGGPPSAEGYRSLGRHGVTTVVDLRPDPPTARERALIRANDMDLVHIPIHDGQTPSAADVRRFTALVRASDGRVFLHCSEGVGRTGTMASAYAVTTGQSGSTRAVRESLSVGVLTLEQIAYIRALDQDGVHDPPLVAVAVSRFLDSPRQLYNTLI